MHITAEYDKLLDVDKSAVTNSGECIMFFVEAPLDEYGNRAYTNANVCVIEAKIESDLGAEILQIIAPDVIRSKWPTIRFFPYQWVECDGPARMITHEERDEIVALNKSGGKQC